MTPTPPPVSSRRTARAFPARASRVGIGAAAVSICFVILAVIGAWVAPYDPTQINVGPRLATPDGELWPGTDARGRDQFPRVRVAIPPPPAAAATATATT